MLTDAAFVLFVYPVVSRLVLVIDPVEGFHRAILDAVFGDPLVRVAAALSQDARHHLHLLQVDLEPLVLVVELGEPRAADKTKRVGKTPKHVVLFKGPPDHTRLDCSWIFNIKVVSV